jgi:SAM-dependent methyltransferase
MTPEPPPAVPSARRPRLLAGLFGVTAFVAAFLVFVVQPLVARTMLPVLGGSASVWNSAMVTFQLLLLAGYLLAHLGATRLRSTAHPPAAVGLAVVAAVVLPVGLREGWRPSGADPAWWTIMAVAAAVGLPFLALACVSPTLQRWYAQVRPDVDPYVLYSAGNAGSFVGLLAYPLVIERTSGVGTQRALWSAGYLGFLVLYGACAALAWRVARRRGMSADPGHGRDGTVAVTVSTRSFLRWTAMSAGPSLLLLGVTRHLATDVAAIPLLWVVPLSLYLLTFVVVFSSRGPAVAGAAERLAVVLAAVVLVTLVAHIPGSAGIGLNLLAFSALTLATHGRLVAERPDASALTSFYLAMSLGGAVGGLVGGLLAPLVFPAIFEYPLGVLACVVWLRPRLALGSALRPVAVGLTALLLVVAVVVRSDVSGIDGPTAMRDLVVVLGLVVLVSFTWIRVGWQLAGVLAVVAAITVAVPDPQQVVGRRTYYGVTRVLENDRGWKVMISGTTIHGTQDPARPRQALEYYMDGGPLHDVFDRTGAGGPRSVGVVGLGAGSMAAWLDEDDEAVFYEIDPAVIEVASDADVFSFLADARGDVEVVEGDGRLSLATTDGRHDLLYVDAFSSDAIPVHLVTREALAVYRRALAADGVVVFHVSNRHFDLRPVVGRLAADASLTALTRSGRGAGEGAADTTAVAVGSDRALAGLRATPGWVPVPAGSDLWTDERADVLGALTSL